MKVWIGLLLLAVAANALEIDLVCNQTKRNGVCDREVVSAGFYHTCGVTSEGLIECFGKDDFGQCNGHRPKKASQGTFVRVSAWSAGEPAFSRAACCIAFTSSISFCSDSSLS